MKKIIFCAIVVTLYCGPLFAQMEEIDFRYHNMLFTGQTSLIHEPILSERPASISTVLDDGIATLATPIFSHRASSSKKKVNGLVNPIQSEVTPINSQRAGTVAGIALHSNAILHSTNITLSAMALSTSTPTTTYSFEGETGEMLYSLKAKPYVDPLGSVSVGNGLIVLLVLLSLYVVAFIIRQRAKGDTTNENI